LDRFLSSFQCDDPFGNERPFVQRGRYAPGETDLKKFIVEGEQHYWVHVAIDRFTGQVIDKQIEVVNE